MSGKITLGEIQASGFALTYGALTLNQHEYYS